MKSLLTVKMTVKMTDLAEDDLRREVLWSPAQRPGPPLHSLSEPKICDLQLLYISLDLGLRTYEILNMK